MISEYLIIGGIELLSIVLSLFQLPQVPDNLLNSLTRWLELLRDNAQLLGLFIRPSTMVIASTVIVALFGFEFSYKFWRKAIRIFK